MNVMTFDNRVRVATNTVGTGQLVLGPALAGMVGFNNILNGATVSYTIEDGPLAWEVGQGTYTTDGITGFLSRDVIEASTNGGTQIVLSGQANVFVTPSAGWLNAVQASIASVAAPIATGSTTSRTLQDRFGDWLNVKDFGAKLDGATNDSVAFNAARNSVHANGTIYVPAGGWNSPATPSGPSDGSVLWQLSGNAFGTGSTPVINIGTSRDPVESFFSGTKYYGRLHNANNATPGFRIDYNLDTPGGSQGWVAPAFQVNATVGSGVIDSPWGIMSNLTVNAATSNLWPQPLAIGINVYKNASAQSWGMGIYVDDSQGVSSATGGGINAVEMGIKVNGLDDATGVTNTGYGSRRFFDLIASTHGTGAPGEVGNAVLVRTNGTASVRHGFHTLNSVTSSFTAEASGVVGLDTSPGTFSSGSAVRLAAGQNLSFVAGDDHYLQYQTTGTARLRYMVGANERWSVDDGGNETVGGNSSIGGNQTIAGNVTITGTLSAGSSPFATTAFVNATFVPLTQVAQPSGVASLDATGKVPSTQLPAAATGTLNFKGGWNANTNTPTMASGALVGGVLAPRGDYYVVTVGGTTAAIDGTTTWVAGDWILSNGTVWTRVQITSTPYLPLVGGALSLPGTITGIGGLTFTTLDNIIPTSPLIPDLLWGLVDSTSGAVAVELDRAGVLWIAMAGITSLQADPTIPLGAATKQYVDALRSNNLPLVAGTANAGTSLTLSRSDHVHPSDSSRAPINAPVFTTSVTLGTDTWQPSLEPDIVWSLRDSTNGNIAVWLDSAGVFSVASLFAASLSATSLTGLTTLSATTATFTQATTANELVSDVLYPDLIGGVMGTNGNVIFGFDVVTGETNAVSINAGAVKINGVSVTAATPVPSDAVDIKAAPYNAQGDGVRNHGYVTTSGSVLTIVNFTGTLSLSIVDATTARLDIVGAAWSGWAFQPHHEGKLLYLTAPAGYTFLAPVKAHGYVSGQSVLLDTTGLTVTPQTSVSGTVVCPAIDTSKSVAGKCLIIEGMGRGQWWAQTPTVSRQVDTVTPYGVQTWYTKTIASFTAPNSITITGTFPFNWTNVASVVVWGSDDSNAAITAGLDVWPLKKRLWFSGGGLYLLPGAIGDNSARPNYSNAPTANVGPLFNGCIWAGDNSSAYCLTTGGQRMPHRVSPQGAPRYNDVPKMVHGRLSFPRCAQIPANQTINVLFDGDSLSAYNPQGQLAAVMGATRFVMEFISQNPGKKINFYNVGVGGATWASMASQHSQYNSSSGNPYKYFTIPKPIAGTVLHTAFWSNINQTGVGAPIVPDLVVCFLNAGNDKLSIDGECLHAAINQIRNVSHGDAYGPTDVVMQCDHHATMIVVYSDGVSGGSALPGAASATMSEFYNGGLNRTTAISRGFPLIDYQPLQERQAWGYDPIRRAMRQVPKVTISPTPAVPISLSEECNDFAGYINMAAANEAAGWAAVQQIEFQISPHPANRLFLRLGPNGNIWAASSAYGRFTDTVVTCTTGSNVITLGASTSYPANVTFRSGWSQVDCGDASITFTSAMNGQCVIAPTGNYDGVAFGRPMQRNYIRMVMDANDAMMDQVPADNADVAVTSATPILIGPNQFIEYDNRACPDVVIIYPDGTIQNTQVAYGGYISATQATLVDAPVQNLTAQTVRLFVGRMGMKWFDTGVTPSSTANIGNVTFSVIRGEFAIGYIADPSTQVSQVFAVKNLERFGGAFNPVVYVQGAQQFTLSNRWVDDDIPIAASTPAWYQRGIIDANSDYVQGGTGGHYGSMMKAAVLDTLYAHQNLSVN